MIARSRPVLVLLTVSSIFRSENGPEEIGVKVRIVRRLRCLMAQVHEAQPAYVGELHTRLFHELPPEGFKVRFTGFDSPARKMWGHSRLHEEYVLVTEHERPHGSHKFRWRLIACDVGGYGQLISLRAKKHRSLHPPANNVAGNSSTAGSDAMRIGYLNRGAGLSMACWSRRMKAAATAPSMVW